MKWLLIIALAILSFWLVQKIPFKAKVPSRKVIPLPEVFSKHAPEIQLLGVLAISIVIGLKIMGDFKS